MPFLCSNAAAIFSSEGLEALQDSDWKARLPAWMTWLGLLLGLAFLVGAMRFDRRHEMKRKEMLQVWEISEEVGQRWAKDIKRWLTCAGEVYQEEVHGSAEGHLNAVLLHFSGQEEMEFHPKRILKTGQKVLLKHLHSQILLSELGVDLKLLKQLYTTAGFTRLHLEARDLLTKFHSSSMAQRTAVLFRLHCSFA